jgi:replicative DNA helicase
MADTASRMAPHSKQSEMMVLGCMLTQVSGLNVAADALDETDFYFTEHRILFSVLKGLYKKDKPADVHLVCEELRRQNRLDSVGGVAYVTALAQFVGTSAYTEEYVELVRNKSLLRRMIQAAQRAERLAVDEPEDVHAALDEAQQLFFSISQSANPVAGTHIAELLSGVKGHAQQPYLKELQERQEQYQRRGPEDPGITGLPTHFTDLDKLVNGLGESNLMILAARPAMGKTALALNIAEQVCFKSRVPVGIFSLEMTGEQLLHRIVCSQSQVESDKIRTGAIDGLEFQRIVGSVNQMMGHTMLIDDQPGLKITDLRARARRMKEAHRVELIIIDYLQLISGSGSNRSIESRQNEISEISRMLKTLARELHVPIICLSQLSRRVEERQGHRPMMSDLRESGCITGDARLIDASSGKEVTIQELAERPVQKPLWVWAMEDGFKPRPHRLVKAFFSGVKPVFELRTSSGRCI